MKTIIINGLQVSVPEGADVFGIEDPYPDFTRITKLAFKQRLTQAERIAIRQAALSNLVVYDFMDLMDSAAFIDLSRQDTIDGLNQMEAAGLMDEGRANEILTAAIQDHEVFRG